MKMNHKIFSEITFHLLALRGVKDVEHMDKVKVLEHIYLMYQLTGGVMDD